MGTGVFQRRLVFGNHRFRAFALLQVVIQSCNFHCQLRLGLMDALAIDAVIYLQQQLAFFNLREILNMDLGNVAVYLRTDERGLAAHVGVIGKLGMTRKRGQLPGIKDHQYPDNADSRGGEDGNDAHIFAGVGLLFGGILLTHNFS